jgi:hypothetical protein
MRPRADKTVATLFSSRPAPTAEGLVCASGIISRRTALYSVRIKERQYETTSSVALVGWPEAPARPPLRSERTPSSPLWSEVREKRRCSRSGPALGRGISGY